MRARFHLVHQRLTFDRSLHDVVLFFDAMCGPDILCFASGREWFYILCILWSFDWL